MTTTVLLTGERHQVAMTLVDDPRIVHTVCGEWVANIGSPFDSTSAYQRRVFPLAEHPVPCRRCRR